jgi:hypothetical protein
MKYTPDPQYRDEALSILEGAARSGALQAIRMHVNADGSRTDVNVLGIVNGRIQDLTMQVAQALCEPVYRTNVRPLAIRLSSGGVNPVTVLEDGIRRALRLDWVQVHES